MLPVNDNFHFTLLNPASEETKVKGGRGTRQEKKKGQGKTLSLKRNCSHKMARGTTKTVIYPTRWRKSEARSSPHIPVLPFRTQSQNQIQNMTFQIPAARWWTERCTPSDSSKSFEQSGVVTEGKVISDKKGNPKIRLPNTSCSLVD